MCRTKSLRQIFSVKYHNQKEIIRIVILLLGALVIKRLSPTLNITMHYRLKERALFMSPEINSKCM